MPIVDVDACNWMDLVDRERRTDSEIQIRAQTVRGRELGEQIIFKYTIRDDEQRRKYSYCVSTLKFHLTS